MKTALTKNEIEAALAGIRESLAEADKIAFQWETVLSSNQRIDAQEQALAAHFVRRAFVQSIVFLEAAELPATLEEVRKLDERAKKNYVETEYYEDIYLKWSYRLGLYLDGVENAIGPKKAGTVTKDLIQILRGTLYAITDRRCFAAPPQGEPDVHGRIEAVLRCVFPDLRHKPKISKPIKNFEPDTGLPSLRTLIEYKFVDSLEVAKAVSDEVLADTRGYTSKDWDSFVYVIYETKRIKREEEWVAHLRENGVGEETNIIVLFGESRAQSFAEDQSERSQTRKRSE